MVVADEALQIVVHGGAMEAQIASAAAAAAADHSCAGMEKLRMEMVLQEVAAHCRAQSAAIAAAAAVVVAVVAVVAAVAMAMAMAMAMAALPPLYLAQQMPLAFAEELVRELPSIRHHLPETLENAEQGFKQQSPTI
jgi:hypothetical protein